MEVSDKSAKEKDKNCVSSASGTETPTNKSESCCRPKQIAKMSGKSSGSGKKKGRNAYVVQSRYLMNVKKKPISNNIKPVIGLTPKPKNKLFSSSYRSQLFGSFEKSSVKGKKHGVDDCAINSNEHQEVFSTPTKVDTTAVYFDEVSCISSTCSSVSSTKSYPPILKELAPNYFKKEHLLNASMIQSQQKSELLMEMLYSRYLQAVLVSLKMKNQLEEQQKKDLMRIWNLHLLIGENSVEELELRNKHAFLENRLRTSKALKYQITEISPMITKLTTLDERMKEVTQLVQRTQNQLQFKSTLKISPEALSTGLHELMMQLDSVECQIKEMQQSLLLLRTVSKISENGKIQTASIATLKDNLASLDNLVIDELSLKIGKIQVENKLQI